MKQLIIFGIALIFLLGAQIYLTIKSSQYKKYWIVKEPSLDDNGKTIIKWEDNIGKFLINFSRRLSMSWAMFIVVGFAFLFGFFGLTIFFMLLSFLALREFVSIMHLKPSDYWPMFCSFYIFLPLQYFFVLTDWQFLFFIFIPVYVFLFTPILSVALADDEEQFFERASKFQWAQIACIYCISYLPAIAGLTLRKGEFQSTTLLIFFICVIAASDSFQYILGNHFGKKKIAPRLSPNKTWEGTIYGILTASVIGAALFWLTPFTWWQSFILALAISTMGFFGGLVLSGIKRSLKIKDWGDVLGAHGGILDRVDAMIFAAPLFYHLCKYFFS